MKKRVLSILLTVCMVLTLLPGVALASTNYGIWVGSTQITSDNADGVTGDGISGTITYNAATNALTLNNATVTTTTETGVNGTSRFGGIFKYDDDLNIVLVGTNTIDISGVTGLLTSGGIMVNNGGLTITGASVSDSLTVIGAPNTTNYNSSGIYSQGNMTISNCTVNASAGNSNGSCVGISANSSNYTLTMENAVVTATGGSTSGLSLGAFSGRMNITNSTLTAAGSTCGIYLYNSFIASAGQTATASSNKSGSGAQTVNVAMPPRDWDYYKYVRIGPVPGVNIGTLSVSNTFTAGHSIALSALSTYIPAVTPTGGASITTQGWQASVTWGGTSDSWSNWPSGGVLSPDTSLTYKLRYYVTYQADGSSKTVTSNTVTLTIVSNATTLALTASPASPQSAGTPVALTATLTGFLTGPGVNGQTITFKNGGSTLGTANMNSSGVATYTWTPGNTGTYSLTAEYAATVYNTAAASDTLSYAVRSTAAKYSEGAISGIDYVLDSVNESLTIKTAKGAAFWSANSSDYLRYTVKLDADIDVSTFLWVPVGTSESTAFTGTFDGRGHSITGLTIYINTSDNFAYIGLFGYANNAIIKNLCIASGSIQFSTTGINSSVGSLVGTADYSTISNCCNHATVSGAYNGTEHSAVNVGGLVGVTSFSTSSNCFNTGSVSASGVSDVGCTANAAGLDGFIHGGGLVNCYNTGMVSASGADTNVAAGILGYELGAAVTNCYYLATTADKGTKQNTQFTTGCGSFDASGALTAGTAAQFGGTTEQTLTYTGSLLSALNSWVDATASTAYYAWKADSGNINGGYPVLDARSPTFIFCNETATNGSYNVKVDGSEAASAQLGKTVTITATAYDDYELDTIFVHKTGDTNIAVAVTNGTFIMPDYAVTIRVIFKAAVSPLDLTGVGYDVAAGTITGTTANMQYSLDGGSIWQDCAADNTTGLTFVAGTVKVRQKDKVTNVATVSTLASPAESGAPTLGSKTYNSVTLTAMTGYEYSKDGGATWQDSNIFSGLNSNTEYSFLARIKANATTLPGTASTTLTVTTDSALSGGGISPGNGSASTSTTTSTGAPVIVDGKTVNIGKENKAGDATTVTVDQSKLGENIVSAVAGSSVVVPVSENGAATASLVVKNIEDMAQKGMTLTVQTGSVAYNLNTSAIDTAALTAAFPGADMSEVPFDVTIQNSSVRVEGETLVLSPVAFTVTAAYNGKTVRVDTFSAYVNRVIEVTANQAAKITTAVVVNADGSTRHVPTNVIEKDGKYYAIINSRTNSTYALIQNEVTFADASGKWYEAAVNEMGSRKIIEGRSASVFDGGASITRAEFAAILVRALGLPAEGTSSFSDVPTNAWYTGAVATAAQYGIVGGKGNNRYAPNAAITRQEAMLMLKRAASLTELRGASSALDSFADAGRVGSWAEDAAKWNVGTGLIQGTDGKLKPTANITRAESATIILRLLQKAGLVDVRS